ncbi:MAG: pyruvate kinase [Chromatiales bacterium]|jgi:pyruvate kinase
MTRRKHKTKIVCTIGPASESVPVLERLIGVGMNVARLNFSHGDFDSHRQVIENIRAASRATGRMVAIMADLPGPKIRVGELDRDAIELIDGEAFTLTTESILGDDARISVAFPQLADVVHSGDMLYLNDGFIQLQVERVEGTEVRCRVVVGGDLRARKGLNLPGIELGISAFTERDRECLEFALEHGVDAVSQSFVAGPEDVLAVRSAASAMGRETFVIAKIERASALQNIDAILEVADGIMVARGDLGVEIPIEQMAVVQKELMDKANRIGRPVITATHMLESMVDHRRPTRAEATDVANAILDGTDCVMLSGESAMGRYPVDAAAMLAKIAAATEPHRTDDRLKRAMQSFRRGDPVSAVDLISLSVHRTIESSRPVAVIVPTRSGASARNVARFRLPIWISAFSSETSTCQQLQFSYGVDPIYADEDLAEWGDHARTWLAEQGMTDGIALLAQGPSLQNPQGNHRLEIIELGEKSLS